MNKENNGWAPIETAPKSVVRGRTIDAIYLEVYCPDMVGPNTDLNVGICIGWWEPLMRPPCWTGELGVTLNPTHWRYLRPPPKDAERWGRG
jgi:hypothetical protein